MRYQAALHPDDGKARVLQGLPGGSNGGRYSFAANRAATADWMDRPVKTPAMMIIRP